MTTRDTPEAALAAALDHHWLESSIAMSSAWCSCGEWHVDIPGRILVPQLGEHFQPFSEHVAAAILAALPPDWCGHERTTRLFTELSESYTEAEVKIARLKEVAVAIATQRNEAWAEIARLRAALGKVVMHLERGGDWTTMTPIVAALDVARAALAPAPSEP